MQTKTATVATFKIYLKIYLRAEFVPTEECHGVQWHYFQTKTKSIRF